MDQESLETHPAWLDASPHEPLRPMLTNTTADVCVVGAGVSGLTVAYELVRRGARVVVLDEGGVASGQTRRTTAHLVTALDERYFELERLHDSRTAALARESHQAAIDRIESIVRSEGIRCGFTRVDGYIFVPESMRNAGVLLSRELDAARRAGAEAHTLLVTPGLRDERACLHFPRQAQLQPLLYVHGLRDALLSRGGRVYTGTRVVSVEAALRVVVRTADGLEVHAGAVVIAANTPLRERWPALHEQVAYRSYVAAMEIAPGALEPALYWDGYWDDDTPYHYVRLARASLDGAFDLLVVGGEDEAMGDINEEVPDGRVAERAERLHAWARRHFHGVGRTTHRWAGRILEPGDELAYIGRVQDESGPVFAVSGDSGNGMTYASIAGMMLPELIEGRTHAWERTYSPSRSRPDRSARRVRAGLSTPGVSDERGTIGLMESRPSTSRSPQTPP